MLAGSLLGTFSVVHIVQSVDVFKTSQSTIPVEAVHDTHFGNSCPVLPTIEDLLD